MNIKQRLLAPTPKFWKKVQRLGIALTAVGTFVATAPISLPATIVTLGGYAAFGGGLITVLSQLTVDDIKKVEETH
jgi:ABC-type xylose transport system permease subunit